MSTVDTWRAGMRAHGGNPDMVYPDGCRETLARLAEALAVGASMGVLEPLIAHTETCPHCGAEAQAIQNYAQWGEQHVTVHTQPDRAYRHHNRRSGPFSRSQTFL